ncbi:TetR/AcrR family transcriptional regulator [Cryptosporangium arvum]|uniref:Transcriptional regulator n=1 Tax=Cryptosporangium arvum DSM 44712 TaxID=927661 RepID=A0A010YR54_9ACTN|nr:TetR/AcrR family transcriptional regulator [Cryptosporangium arvum]EXG82675.1 transcriptional regulator [Cryptosporangium arvum DSM 44712]
MGTGRDAIAEAAFGLFATRGYEETSVEDIAAAAGVSRSTFFRAYGSKEAVIFPDHDELLRRVEERLTSTTADAALKAVTEAVKLVLFHYVAEGERARERYRLTSAVEALRDRELISGARYQRLFRRFLGDWGDGSEAAELRAELTSAAVVAAHNHVLRRWLRGESVDPHAEVETALADVRATFDPASRREPVAVLVVPTGLAMSDAESAIRRALGGASNVDG